MNRITGERTIEINGQGYTMRFTWRALAEVEAEYGDNPNLFKPEVLAKVTAAGLREKHPDMTAERIMELSPPLMPLCVAVREAIQWAYFGAETVPKTEARTEVKKPPGGWVLKAYKAAVAAGVNPAEFWNLTPYLTGKAVVAMNDETTTRIWTLAAMTRAKKLPKLDKLLSKTKPEKKDMTGLKMALAGMIPKKRTENG